MPIEGKFYQHQELQELLNVSKQRISNLAAKQNWSGPQPGLFWAEDVEPYLQHNRRIDPAKLSIITYDYPDGATWAERELDYDNTMTLD